MSRSAAPWIRNGHVYLRRRGHRAHGASIGTNLGRRRSKGSRGRNSDEHSRRRIVIDATAYIAPSAWIAGPFASVPVRRSWFGAVCAVDMERIEIGVEMQRSGQLRPAHDGIAPRLGDRVTGGHGAIVPVRWWRQSLISMGAVVLNAVSSDATAWSAPVPRAGTDENPDGSMVLGVGEVIRQLTPVAGRACGEERRGVRRLAGPVSRRQAPDPPGGLDKLAPGGHAFQFSKAFHTRRGHRGESRLQRLKL